VVAHNYQHPGLYEVCVRIVYFGGCEARKCKPIQISENCSADFEKIISTVINPLRAYYRALPWHNNNKKPQRICWDFGDGRDTCINYPTSYTGQYVVAHNYQHPGLYEVCVRIIYFGGCEARKCKPIQIGDSCRADFEKIISTTINPLRAYYRALPWHNNNKKPQRICWQFGDGRDTCINYTSSYTGQYLVAHNYQHPGLYEVCVRIIYFGGCEARKCKPIQIGDSCRADFEKIISTTINPLRAYYRALPWHNNNKKPQRICWQFGDGTDTCINYTSSYTGQYLVAHNYQHPGLYEVCVRIIYFGGCEARKCKEIRIGVPDECTADFERLPTGPNLLSVGFRALPWNNHNRNAQRICWQFGDGSDTCINYPENYTGQYTVVHRYDHPGNYEVCVKIFYYGGCEARKCKNIVVPPAQQCSVNIIQIIPGVNSFTRGFFASVSSSPFRRPVRICWDFGDGDDTCIFIPVTVTNFLPYLFISHTYPGPGMYRACVTVRFQEGCEARDCEEVFIRSQSSVCGGFMMDSLIAPRSYRFKGFGIHNNNDEVVSYLWTFGDGTTASGREVTHTYNQPGEYEVCLRMRTRLGCETRICKPLRVPANHNAVLQLSPNPVVDILHVSFFSTHTETVIIKIINGNGTTVRTFTRNVTMGANVWSHDLTLLIPGAYSYSVQSPNQLASAIFLKQ
jgi:PKD repeat protein